MTCYHPLHGFRSKIVNPTTGKRSIVFSQKLGFVDLPVTLPCGRCIGCRLEKSRQWAVRCLHEASLYSDNCFITLTYDEKHLPKDGSLHLSHFQKFMKRLRKKFGDKIRFFHCGEYGDQNRRPHYHACIFNFDFPDRKLWKTRDGVRLYTSEILHDLWPFGYNVIGDVTFESAAYVARYITKKITGDRAKDHYTTIDPRTGEICELKPEYTTMSRRPGIGSDWFVKYLEDVYPRDFVVVRGKKQKPPKAYDRYLEKVKPAEYEIIKACRIHDALELEFENSYDRLNVKEIIKISKFKQLKRGYENES